MLSSERRAELVRALPSSADKLTELISKNKINITRKQMKKLLISSLTMLLGFVSISCEEENSNNERASNNFPFLKTENTWTYKVTIDGGNAPSDVTYKIQSMDENGFCTILFTTMTDVAHTDYVWYSNSDFFANESGSETDYWFPLFYKSSNVGKKWSSPVDDEDLGKITREILSISESISVPAGTFSNCIKIKETFEKDSKIINYYFVSPQIGIIKRDDTGWADIDDEPRIYFPIVSELKSKNF